MNALLPYQLRHRFILELSLRWPCSFGPRPGTRKLDAGRLAFSSEIKRSANSPTVSSFSKTLLIFQAAAHQNFSKTKTSTHYVHVDHAFKALAYNHSMLSASQSGADLFFP
jgi:hypothetical protein